MLVVVSWYLWALWAAGWGWVLIPAAVFSAMFVGVVFAAAVAARAGRTAVDHAWRPRR